MAYLVKTSGSMHRLASRMYSKGDSCCISARSTFADKEAAAEHAGLDKRGRVNVDNARDIAIYREAGYWRTQGKRWVA